MVLGQQKLQQMISEHPLYKMRHQMKSSEMVLTSEENQIRNPQLQITRDQKIGEGLPPAVLLSRAPTSGPKVPGPTAVLPLPPNLPSPFWARPRPRPQLPRVRSSMTRYMWLQG